MKWQPLESAPKDGSLVDLWSRDYGRVADCKFAFVDSPPHDKREFYRNNKVWVSYHDLWNEWVEISGHFSHWMRVVSPSEDHL